MIMEMGNFCDLFIVYRIRLYFVWYNGSRNEVYLFMCFNIIFVRFLFFVVVVDFLVYEYIFEYLVKMFNNSYNYYYEWYLN